MVINTVGSVVWVNRRRRRREGEAQQQLAGRARGYSGEGFGIQVWCGGGVGCLIP